MGTILRQQNSFMGFQHPLYYDPYLVLAEWVGIGTRTE